MKVVLEMGRLSLKMLNTEDLEEGLLCWDLVGYERKGIATGISLLSGSVEQPGVRLSTGDFERLLKGALEAGVSLYGSSAKGNCRSAPLLGFLEDR